ncbi:hypothetical protein F5X68DRAFT_248042 [Plectosphaerella plurivora]|uniref:Uncharacterized protein n=1 Tax=Plectosphaerella plurivora TaxID=936078 RepID=A0A9P9ABQ7_9PEZI|nr:hypothetical protein F5X68DRAFT_248042 [Plectosphaerella plurivora]
MQQQSVTVGRDIQGVFWPGQSLSTTKDAYYERLSERVSTELSTLEKKYPKYLPKNSAFDILAFLQPSAITTRRALTEAITTSRRELLHCPGAVEDIASVIVWCWTMVVVNLQSKSVSASPGWDYDEPLQDAVATAFRQLATSSEGYSPREVDPDLSAASLKHHQNVRIEWTTVITEHLQLTRRGDSISLSVFEHKIWVRNQLNAGPDRCAVPAEVLEELMMTLNLLFPIGDPPTEKLLRRHERETSILSVGYCRRDRPRDLRWYKYWRGRLSALDDLLNGPQRGFRNVWRLGRRKENMMNVFVFWTSGVVVLVPTIVCGIWSLVVSREGYNLAVKAYDLAVAQACADPDVRENLPQYCK